ncbi:hypothetical protein [Acinetobacter guerrae]|uniref:pyocin knob domain-containing protein n=1 Tax=Acinetobacter guerrae TaxID=1843371 RepID=UPI00267CCCF3
MAVSEQTPYIEYTANGTTTSFALNFDCNNQDHLIVLVDDLEPVVGSWSLSSGDVVFNTAPENGKKITIQRNTPFSRTTDYQSYNNSFRPPAVNNDFDRIWWKLQELGVADWILSNRISALKAYVDDRDDELRAYLLEEIRKQGVALDQLDEYYNYLMERLAQIAVDKGWDASFVVDGNLTQHERNLGIESLAQLRLTQPSKKGDRVFLASVNIDQNEGGGEFIATQKAGLVDDGGLIVASPDPLLFWVRINYDFVTPEMFGAKPTGDNYVPLQAALNSGTSKELKLTRNYNTSKPLRITVNSPRKITGLGEDVTRITKTTNDTITIQDGSNSYTVDTIFAFDRSGGENNYYLDCSNFALACGTSTSDPVAWKGYGIYGRGVALSKFSQIRVFYAATGIHIEDSWMNVWQRVTSQASNGWKISTGTSNLFDNCWVVGRGAGTAYEFNNLMYSTMNACGCDYFGWSGEPGTAIFNIKWSKIVINSFGYEHCYLNRFMYTQQSDVIFNNIQGYAQTNVNIYPAGSGAWLDIYGSRVTLNNCSWGLAYSQIAESPNFDARVNVQFANVADSSGHGVLKVYEGDSLAIWDTGVYVESGYLDFKVGGRHEFRSGGAVPAATHTTTERISSSQAILGYNGFGGDRNPDTITETGFYHTTAHPSSPLNFYMLVHGQHRSDSGYSFQMGVPAGESNCANAKMRVRNNGTWSTPVLIRNGDNTIVDGNGFIKNASPIVQLFADKIELNNEAQQQNIEFEKLGVGDYLVKGSSGFAQDGWYIETPKDANGNVLVAVVYKQLENNDISIKTYAKKFDDEAGDIVPNLSKPRDIPENRSITLRLQELPKVEQEIVPE